MKQVIIHILLFTLGALMLTAVMVFEINGTPGFLLATFGLFFVVIGATWKVLINFLLP